MEHIEFIEKLSSLGCAIRGTKRENSAQTIFAPTTGATERKIIVKNFVCSYSPVVEEADSTPLQKLISLAIDMDTWKHSMHYSIHEENYEKFIEIIQEKIIKRAEDIDLLLTVYFQLLHEISSATNQQTNQLEV